MPRSVFMAAMLEGWNNETVLRKCIVLICPPTWRQWRQMKMLHTVDGPSEKEHFNGQPRSQGFSLLVAWEKPSHRLETDAYSQSRHEERLTLICCTLCIHVVYFYILYWIIMGIWTFLRIKFILYRWLFTGLVVSASVIFSEPGNELAATAHLNQIAFLFYLIFLIFICNDCVDWTGVSVQI